MLEVLAQLGEIYLARGANDGVRESIRRIHDCLAIYARMPAADAEIAHLICRYSRRAQFLRTGSGRGRGRSRRRRGGAGGVGDEDPDADFADLADEHALPAHPRAGPVRDRAVRRRPACAFASVVGAGARCREIDDYRGTAASSPTISWSPRPPRTAGSASRPGGCPRPSPGCVAPGPGRRQNGWELATATNAIGARRGAAGRWATTPSTEQLVSQAYPVIARYARAHDVARCWLYLGLTRLASGALEAADECWEHAERHWRELGKPLHLHRILLQRSWIADLLGPVRPRRSR